MALHVNAGRDFLRGERDLPRAGVALEWAPAQAWSLVAERFRENEVNFRRLGVRWLLHDSLSLDLSRTHGLHNGAAPWWTAGLRWEFSR